VSVAGLKRTPLHDRHVALGARMVPFAGWEMPVQYDGVIPEHLAVRRDRGVFDVSHMGQFHVEGPRQAELLQSLLSNDLSRLADGEAQYTLLTNDSGGIVDDLIAYRLGAFHTLLVVNAGNRDAAYSWLKEREISGTEVRDASDEYALLAVQGPTALASLGLAEGPAFTHAMGEVFGVEVMVCRTGYTGEPGVELMCPAEDAVELWNAIVANGAASGRATRFGSRCVTRCTETTSQARRTRSPRVSAGRARSTRSSPASRSCGGSRRRDRRGGSSRS